MPRARSSGRPRRPDPPPLETDDVRAVAVGGALWLVTLLVLLPFTERLREDGRGYWVGAAAYGVLLGVIGIVYCRRRARAIARDRAVSSGATGG